MSRPGNLNPGNLSRPGNLDSNGSLSRPGRSRRYLAAALLAAGLGIGACGTEPPSSVSSSSASSTEAPAPAPPAAAAPGPAAIGDPGAVPVRQASPAAAQELPAPVRVEVEGTGIDLEVVPVGVEDNGAMTIPDNHYQAGWYRYGPAPGAESGSSVLAAHVDSQTEVLPIAGLKDVAPGTRITVSREDGTTVDYRTERVENIAKRSLDGHRLFDRTGSHLLKLVTCGGKWLDTENDYEDNVVLTAAPLS